jgi:hypothetical protein
MNIKKVPFFQFETRYNEATQKAIKERVRSALVVEEGEWMKHNRELYP